jgi:hypothetical protein
MFAPRELSPLKLNILTLCVSADNDHTNRHKGDEVKNSIVELQVGSMFKMPTGEVLKIKSMKNSKGNFVARLFGLKGKWTQYAIEGEADAIHKFFTEGGAKLVSNSDYPEEPEDMEFKS